MIKKQENSKKILVVDDDSNLVESIAAILQAEGYTVFTAANGTEGLRQAQTQQPDLILLDVMMDHDHEGFEVVKRLQGQQKGATLPVIIMTGIRKAKRLPFAYEPDADWLPVQAVLEKPVDPRVLLKRVAKALSASSR